ncbi:enoyl-CoA hydratase/isomerase [Syncephalis pseudoplumigaleata]|uniref:Enoyl-CoA hydratase/isomerase n=1 Tax=Syncephalis pseudoplumigaleata TaxID=1712513 RepID=A0A4P9YTY8_9FUNG|nr:enoyl-CoA hydratase/isomerase [Syncephalis pseudoplumigaleata]|eukprot:RKP23473.1 enoyl-CoA hydratase/isomerase [Syncephalis pseudoplumigaleata]
MMTLSRHGCVFLLTLQRADNRFDFESTKAILTALDEVEAVVEKEDPTRSQPWALVTTGHDRIYSNGLDPSKVFAHMKDFTGQLFHPLLRRMLTFPMPTVAAINGHAFAGGLMFAMAHDYRVMRSDRGFLCLNEIDMPAPLTPGMLAVVRAKFPDPASLRNCLLQAHRFGATEALKLGLVDAIAEADKVLPTAIALAEQWSPKAKAGAVMTMIKEEMYQDTVHALREGGLGHVGSFGSKL